MRPTVHVIGNVNVDLIMGPLAGWPQPGTEIVLPHSEIRVGGEAGNVALTFAALGTPYRLYGNCGDDVFGRWLADQLGADAFRHGRIAAATTLSVGVVHPNRERTFLTTEGHLAALDLPHLEPDLATIRPGDVVLLLGAFLTPRLLTHYEALIAEIRRRGAMVAIDTGWPPEGWTVALRERVAGWLRGCDIVLFNEIETTSLTGLADVEAAGEAIARQMGEGAVVITKRGPAGAIGRRCGERHEVAAPSVTVIDTIGAGDVFDAAFLDAWTMRDDLAAALEAAVAVASRAVSTHPRRIDRPETATVPSAETRPV